MGGKCLSLQGGQITEAVLYQSVDMEESTKDSLKGRGRDCTGYVSVHITTVYSV